MRTIPLTLAILLVLSVQGCIGDTSDCVSAGDELVCPEDVSETESAVVDSDHPPVCMQDKYGNCIDGFGGGAVAYCSQTSSCRTCASCSSASLSCQRSCDMCAACLGF